MASKPNKVVRIWVQPRVAFDRLIDFSYFYNNRKWRKTSTSYRIAHPICECKDCELNELIKPAQVCDHIKGIKFLLDNGIDPYDWNELQSMSNECHNKKSGSESKGRKRGMG